MEGTHRVDRSDRLHFHRLCRSPLRIPTRRKPLHPTRSSIASIHLIWGRCRGRHFRCIHQQGRRNPLTKRAFGEHMTAFVKPVASDSSADSRTTFYNGPAAAALIAAGIGSAALGIATTLAEISAGAKKLLNF